MLAAHYKRFKFPKLRVPLLQFSRLLCAAVLGLASHHMFGTEAHVWELVQNSDTLATVSAVSDASHSISDPGCLFVPPASMTL